MDEAKFRASIAAEIRGFAAQVDKLPLADRRDPEKPVHLKIDLAKAMRARADTIVREMGPPEGGLALAKVVFGPAGQAATVERRRARPTTTGPRRIGRIGLALAA